MKNSRGGFTLTEWLVVLVIIFLVLAALVPGVQFVREAARRAQCKNNLHQLSLALLLYEEKFKKFPCEHIRTTSTHGWATAILPDLGVADLVGFQMQFSPSAPENTTAASHWQAVFACPSSPDFGSDWPGVKATTYSFNYFLRSERMSHIEDKASTEKTMLLREIPGEQMFPWPSSPTCTLLQPNWSPHHVGCNVAFVSGSVRWVSAEDEDTIEDVIVNPFPDSQKEKP